MTCSTEISTPAGKALDRVSRVSQLRIAGVIELPSVDPRPPGVKKLRGGEHGRWRVRVGDHRIVYAIEDERLLFLVLRVAHRREGFSR